MSKKLFFIIGGLFAIQLIVYTATHVWNVENEVINTINNYDYDNELLTKYPDFATREIVYLDNHDLMELPKEILLFKNLKYLHLAENNLTTFPYEVLQLELLEHLDLAQNNITSIDLKGVALKNTRLMTLEVDYNKLTNVNGLERLKALTTLNLSNNGLVEVEINNSNLIRLNLSYNALGLFPKLYTPILQTLTLNDNRIEVLDLVKLPHSVSDLNLQNNFINRVISDTEDEYMFSVLETLNLSGNQFREMPIELLKYSYLKNLSLNSNEISSFPLNEIPSSQSLTKLDLSDNELMIFWFDLNEKMPNLVYLYLQDNDLLRIDFTHSTLNMLNIQNNEKADCSLNIPSLVNLDCDLEHINTSNHTVKTPNLEICNIITSVGETLDDAVAKRYENVNLRYK